MKVLIAAIAIIGTVTAAVAALHPLKSPVEERAPVTPKVPAMANTILAMEPPMAKTPGPVGFAWLRFMGYQVKPDWRNPYIASRSTWTIMSKEDLAK